MTIGSRIAGRLAKLPKAGTSEVSVERDLTAKMPDGATLLADRWFPSIPGATTPPTVLLRSPYGRRQLGLIGRLFAERGYQVVIQSCRGTFGSTGVWEPMRNEQDDGRSTLEWIAGQPWFDGKVATFGPSYLGLTQWSVAEDGLDSIAAMALTVTASNFRNAVVYPGESYALELALTWLHQVDNQERGYRHVLRTMMRTPKTVAAAAAVLPLSESDIPLVGRHVEFFQDWLNHETPNDSWWDRIDYGRRREAVPPATLVGGWYDLFLPAQVADYEALRDAGRTARLTIGPWTHASPGGSGAAIRDGLEFFDEHLKGRPSGREPVRLFVMGAKRWVDFPQWPPAAEQQQWFFGRSGTLGTGAPAAGSELPPDTYRYDPADPTPGIGGPSLLGKSAGPRDQRPRESRSDVLTYTSPVMTEDVTVAGPVTTTMYVRSSLEHTDFFVRLCDVSPKGKSTNLSDGIIRLTPGALTPGVDGTARLDISMWPTANTFKAGHRIRLQVSSGAHPLFVRNLGSGERLATGSTMRTADQEIWRDEAHPSCVTLPVVRLPR